MPSQQTALHDCHLELNARMVDFAGWRLPVQYAGVIAEVEAVRQRCGLFDVSHMGQIEVCASPEAVDRLLTNRLDGAAVGRCVYSPMCNPAGGCVDDLIAARLDDDRWLLVVNAARVAVDTPWVSRQLQDGQSRDVSSQYAMMAVQGPLAEAVLQLRCESDLSGVSRNQVLRARVVGQDCLVSRTGYTGEDGFELLVAPSAAPAVWSELVADPRCTPAGLGARDVLRLEAGLPLYGHELSESISPLEAGLAWTVKFDGADFVGKEALLHQSEEGAARELVGLAMQERAVPREGYDVVVGDRTIGRVTSGTFSPTLNHGIALALVAAGSARPGDEVCVTIRNSPRAAVVTDRRFYHPPTQSSAGDAV